MMLEVRDLHVNYGAIRALRGVSLTVDQGEVVTLIGANGAGKTTLLKTLSGLLPAETGTIVFRLDGRVVDLERIPPHEVVRLGISHVPEGRLIFANLKVTENLRMGAYLREDQTEIRKDLRDVFRLFPRLEERAQQPAGTLSGGEQQMLSIGRALMSRPRLLLLDEPSLGIAPFMVTHIFEALRRINESGVTLVLVEQNARRALKFATRGYVLETGEIVLEGKTHFLLDHPRVREAYLGE